MFTDVEGSTALWDGAPLEMSAALVRHDEIVRSALEDHDGFVFATAGDGFGVAFWSAGAAAQAAVAVQLAVAKQRWPVRAAIRVRAGLHTGVAVERDGDYFGTAVNRAARVASLGRGGQVIVSDATSALLVDDGWVLVDVGVHRLEGIERPERLHRLVVPGVEDVDLPLRGAAGVGNLPKRRGRLVGREGEVEAVASLLAPGAVVSVVGVGGVGKTRLALAAAQAAAGRFRDGAWLVELASVVSPEDVGAAVAEALAIQVTGDRTSVEAVVATLVDQERVVVLDNCEHVLDAVVDLIERLGVRCGEVAVLTTTREALGTPDEQVVPLRPLAMAVDEVAGMSPAAVLFHERAGAAVGRFEPSAADRAVVERVCRRLDGLPLAIELAAARVSTMTLDELERRLDERFALLTRRRGAIERHQSLRTTVLWSYDHLDQRERLVFDCLSIFSGSFTVDALHAVTAGTIDATDDVVSSLVAKSMLTVLHTSSGSRFQQLETLRQFGEERLEQRDLARVVHERHLDYVVGWSHRAAAGICGRDEIIWNQALNDEWHNVRSALRWACHTGNAHGAATLLGNVVLWAALRMRLEAADWIDDVLPMIDGDDVRRPALLAYAAIFAGERGDATRANELLAVAEAEDDRLGCRDPWVPVAAGAIHTDRAQMLADAAEAQRRGDRSLYMGCGGMAQEAMVRAIFLQDAVPSDSTWQSELERIQTLVDFCDAFGNPGLISHATTGLGLAHIDRDPALAAELLQRSLDIAVAVDIEYSTSQTRCHLADALGRLQRHTDALELLVPDINRHVRAGSDGFAWFMIRACIEPLIAIGALEVAADLLAAPGLPTFASDRLTEQRARVAAASRAPHVSHLANVSNLMTAADAAAAIQRALAQRIEATAVETTSA